MALRWWCLAFLLLGLAGCACGAETIDPALLTLVQQAPTAADYPAADAVWLLKEMDVAIEPSGAFTVREHRIVKILTARGAALGQWEIPFDQASETVSVLTARTLYRGQVFAVDPALVTDSTVYPGLAWYSSIQVRRFPLPSAVPGAVLEVETEHRYHTARVPGAFSTRLYLRQAYPIEKATYTFRVPAARRLAIRFTGDGTPGLDEAVEGDSRIYRWTLQHLPARSFLEPQAPPAEDVLPSARVTSLSNWEPVVNWYRDITRGKDALTEQIRRIALERTRDCQTPEAKIAALHKAVREIPYVALEMGDQSDIPHDAEEVARLNYGDCKDKATLLRALLKAVGISADYLLVRTTARGRLDPLQFGVDEFNHVMLAVTMPTGNLFLDPTSADAPYNHLPPGADGARGLLVRGKGEIVDLPPSTAAVNTTDIRVRATVRADGSATGTATLTFRGTNAILQRGILAAIAADRYREALEGYLAPRLGQDIVLDAVSVVGVREPEQPLRLAATFSAPHYLQQVGAQRSGMLPTFLYQPNVYRAVHERRDPFVLAIASRVSLDAVITLPPGFSVVHLPAPMRVHSLFGDYRDAAVVRGQQLTYTADLRLESGAFPANSLEAMRKWSAVLALEGRNQLQFYLQRRGR